MRVFIFFDKIGEHVEISFLAGRQILESPIYQFIDGLYSPVGSRSDAIGFKGNRRTSSK